MRLLKFGFSLCAAIGFVWLLDTHHPFGSALPPLGRVVNPFTGFWQNAEPAYQPGIRELDLPGLDEPVEIVFDGRLVPHIFAANLRDAAYAQGYITAKYRLWQLDMTARSAAGRLSEVAGEVALEADRNTRQFGIPRAAEKELKVWETAPDEMSIYEAYAEGVNAYVRSLTPAEYPLEFKLLDYAPEEWTPLKSALVSKSMARMLCFRAEDLPASNTYRLLGKERFDFLFPEWNPRQSPIIPADVRYAFEPVAVPGDTQTTMIGQLWQGPPLPQSPEFVGSNNWAVSGERTASGYPILCNDPHLSLNLPSIWFEVQVHTPQLNAYGVSLPGTPGIIIGFNEQIAWGVTNVGHDVLDFYRLAWLDEAKTEYRYDGSSERVELVEERIAVRGRTTPYVDTVKYTRWGPVVDRYFNGEDEGLAMHWVASDEPEKKPFYIAGTFLQLMSGENYADYDIALAGFDSPAQNFVFAARDGDIAMRVNGNLPLKRPGQGRFIQDGSSPANAWYGFIPRGQVPQVRNPERGFVASANQHSTAPDYPYYYNGGFDDYRGRLINRELDRAGSLTADDMKALQNNAYSLFAEEGLPALLALLDTAALDEGQRRVLDTLTRWDYRFDAAQRAPVAFVQWFDEAYEQTFDELRAWGDSVPVLFPERWRFVELLTADPLDPVFDQAATTGTETARQIVTEAFRTTCAGLASSAEPWGRYKHTVIRHLAGIGAFSLPVEVGGFKEAPNAITENHGPSWRMIVELGPQVNAYGVYPGGQSGNPGSPFYDQMVDTWAKGEYFELFFMKEPTDRQQAVLYSLVLR